MSTRNKNFVLKEIKQSPFTSAHKLSARVDESSDNKVNPEAIKRLLRKN